MSINKNQYEDVGSYIQPLTLKCDYGGQGQIVSFLVRPK